MEQEKVTEELVRQNGNQAAAVMADYAAQGGGAGVLRIEFNRFSNTISIKDSDGNTLLTVTPNVRANLRSTSYSTTAMEVFEVIGNNSVYFTIQGVMVGNDVQVNYTSPVLPNLGLPAPFLFYIDAQSSNSSYPVPYVSITFSYAMGMLLVYIDLCNAFDMQLSEQTGFELFYPDIPQPSGTKCIFRGKICEYTADGCRPIDEAVDGGDTTMSRKLGLNVDNSVIGQLLNMYHNTIIGQLGGGGGGGE